MNELYPDNFIYKIIFKNDIFDQEDFINNLKKQSFFDENSKFSIIRSSKGKYISLTFDFFVESEERADILNKLIYAQTGIFNYYSVVRPGEKDGIN
jgi:putative lipoic acid-binding regulatory protein